MTLLQALAALGALISVAGAGALGERIRRLLVDIRDELRAQRDYLLDHEVRLEDLEHPERWKGARR